MRLTNSIIGGVDKEVETKKWGMRVSMIGEKSGKKKGVWRIFGIEGNIVLWNMTFLEIKVSRVLRSRTMYPLIWGG